MSQKEFRGRFDALLHERIKSAAKDSFRSMSAEIVYRLAKSLEQDGAGAGKPTSKASSMTSGLTMLSARSTARGPRHDHPPRPNAGSWAIDGFTINEESVGLFPNERLAANPVEEARR